MSALVGDALSRKKGRVRLVMTLVAVVIGAVALGTATPSGASWTQTHYHNVTVTTPTVTPVTVMSCTAGALSPVTFNWTAPVGGLTRTGYSYTVTGTITDSGTLAAGATSKQFTSGLLGIGSGTFSLVATTASGWTSVPKTGTLSFLTAILSSCSVP